jgi:hypothetical protein
MARRQRTGARDGRRARVPARAGDSRTHAHPLYGAVPLVPRTTLDEQGHRHIWWQYDPDFRPPLPRGAVRGDVSRQVFCYHHVPRYFYVDEERTCTQCGEPFTFSAREQKYWYEARQFNFHSVPVRCLRCRRRRRTAHALGVQVGHARRAAAGAPGDPDAWLALARALVEARERTSRGDLNEAIGAARRAAGLWPESSEPLLWEGIGQALAGRAARAATCLRTYLERGRGPAHLLAKARLYVERPG